MTYTPEAIARLLGVEFDGKANEYVYRPWPQSRIVPTVETYAISFDGAWTVDMGFRTEADADRAFRHMKRWVAETYGVPPHVAGFTKRPRQYRAAGQRGTNHHRKHRR